MYIFEDEENADEYTGEKGEQNKNKKKKPKVSHIYVHVHVYILLYISNKVNAPHYYMSSTYHHVSFLLLYI